jgi:hypothetical protein
MKLSNAAQTMLLLLVLAGVAFVAYAFLWSPRVASIEEIQKKAKDKRISLQRLDEMLGDRPRAMIKHDNGQPAYITVQHCLISFNGSASSKPNTRTRDDARALAEKLLQKAKDGADFDKLVEENTDDSPPGIYTMANDGFPGNMAPSEAIKKVFARGGMVKAFGNVGFPLEVGEIGMAGHDPEESPFGWHIIKRLK